MGDPMPHKHLHEANRQSWNAAVVAHNSHKKDQAGFLRDGGCTLHSEEIELLGDIGGRRLLHLQCNAGQDSLSLAQRGAIVTGVDISDEAIDLACRLSIESGIPATFHRADVYDWLDAAVAADERYDIAFCSYGAICWLSDLDRWAAGLARLLTPNGHFVTVDYHPVSMMFNERFELAYPYFESGEPLIWAEGITDYVPQAGEALAPSGFVEGVRDFANPHPVHEFQWSIASIITALLRAGLTIERFEEYPYANGAKVFDNMRVAPGRRMYPPEHLPSLPMMFALTARCFAVG